MPTEVPSPTSPWEAEDEAGEWVPRSPRFCFLKEFVVFGLCNVAFWVSVVVA